MGFSHFSSYVVETSSERPEIGDLSMASMSMNMIENVFVIRAGRLSLAYKIIHRDRCIFKAFQTYFMAVTLVLSVL